MLPDDALRQLSAFDVTWEHEEPGSDLTLRTETTEHRFTLINHTTPGAPGRQHIDRAASAGFPILVTATYVSARLAPRLRELDLNFVDTAGNASIRVPGLVVEVSGRPREATSQPRETAPTGRRSGIRVLLTLLAEPERAGEMTVREVARSAGVSVGSAQSVLTDLRENQHLEDHGLYRTGLLFERWLAGYLADRRLQAPRKRLGHRPGWHEAPDVQTALHAIDAVLGGEDAAEVVGLPLRGTSGIIYTPEPVGPVLRAAKMLPDAHGTLEVRDLWWQPTQDAQTVPTPLLYADLVASNDPRQAEAATELRRTDALLRRLDAN